MYKVTCIAPVNIAVIKYWGKRDENLILPINDSLSGTLSTDQLCAKTTVACSADFKENKLWLNGKEEFIDNNQRLVNCLKELRRRAKLCSKRLNIIDWNVHVCSENNFPTAAGLASSAAGYACFVYTVANLYGLAEQEISDIARVGSGSACRSIYGGFVQWKQGENCNGSDSIAVQIVNELHWKDMKVLILVVNDEKKKTSSTGGMSRSVKTSDLLKFRSEKCVPDRINQIIEAIKECDFQKFAKITMQDSNQFHAICLDTYPPCVYLNDVSHRIINLVHQYNDACGEIRCAYTFDAGPNACLYLMDEDVGKILTIVNKVLPNDNSSSVEYVKGLPIDEEKLPENISKQMDLQPYDNNVLKYIIHTKIGEGPKCLTDESESLLNEKGYPKISCSV